MSLSNINWIWWLLATIYFSVPELLLGAPQVSYDTIRDVIEVSDLDETDRYYLLKHKDNIQLQLIDQEGEIPIRFSTYLLNDTLAILPDFPLAKQYPHAVTIDLPDGTIDEIIHPQNGKQEKPFITSLHPSSPIIPSNLLRFYVSFSEPMARDQVREKIRLYDFSGNEVTNTFLNLNTELWDSRQERLTLLIDPGRIKRGVGPNMLAGSPLIEGNTYTLSVSDKMRSAEGLHMKSEFSFSFEVGPAHREPIDPTAWTLSSIYSNTRSPLAVTFDGLIDVGATSKFLTVENEDGDEVIGTHHISGSQWNFVPNHNWVGSNYWLVIDADLEDASGNSVRSSFDTEKSKDTIIDTQSRIQIEVE